MNSAGDDWGKLLLRFTVGGLMLFHGYFKINNGVDFMDGMLEAKGLPVMLKYGAYAGEVAAPVLLILGVFPRLCALVIAGTMGMAIYLAHSTQLMELNNHGGWMIELPAFFLLASLAIVLMGGGKLGVMPNKSE
jgi:putative oxidoreductase